MECAEMCSTFACALAWGDRHAEAVVALLALIVAVVTARVLIKQSEITLADSKRARKHDRLSVRPFLFSHTEQYTNLSYLFPDGSIGPALEVKSVLRNVGLGPAIIKKFEIFLDSEPLNTSDRTMAEAAMTRVFGTHFKRFKLIYRPSNKFGLRPQDDYEFLSMILSLSPNADEKSFRESLRRFDVRVEYESLYEEPEIYDTRLNEQPA
jgi:hypothetical protein